MTRIRLAAPDGGPPAVLEAGPGAGPVTAHLRRVAAGWPEVQVTAGQGDRRASDGDLRDGTAHRDDEPAGFIVRETSGLWRLESESLEDGVAHFDNPLAAANAATGVAIHGLLRSRPDWLCLHAAAFALSGPVPAAVAGAWLLPGGHKAGKSLFAAAAAASGARLLADDRAVLKLAPGGVPSAGVASLVGMGIQPKLRLPLPAGLPPGIAAFIAARLGPHEGEMRFLSLPTGVDGGALLPFGSRAPLVSVCFLERAEDARLPDLRRLGRAEAVARMIPYMYAPGCDAAGRMAAAARLAGGVPVLALRYRDCWDAVNMLQAEAGTRAAVEGGAEDREGAGR